MLSLAWSFIQFFGAVLFAAGLIMTWLGIMGAILQAFDGPDRDGMLMFGLVAAVGVVQLAIGWPLLDRYDRVWPITVGSLLLVAGHVCQVGGFMEHRAERLGRLFHSDPVKMFAISFRFYLAAVPAIIIGWLIT